MLEVGSRGGRVSGGKTKASKAQATKSTGASVIYVSRTHSFVISCTPRFQKKVAKLSAWTGLTFQYGYKPFWSGGQTQRVHLWAMAGDNIKKRRKVRLAKSSRGRARWRRSCAPRLGLDGAWLFDQGHSGFIPCDLSRAHSVLAVACLCGSHFAAGVNRSRCELALGQIGWAQLRPRAVSRFLLLQWLSM